MANRLSLKSQYNNVTNSIFLFVQRAMGDDMYVLLGLSGNVPAVLLGTDNYSKKKTFLRSQISVQTL